MNILRWGLMRRLRRGNKLMLFPTFRCNLTCSYCSIGYLGKRAESTEIGLDDWKYLVRSFPIKLREIRISGGEPMLMPYYSELINWLLDQGLYVMVFTNLSVLKLDVNRSRRLIYMATYHKCSNVKKFQKNLKEYRKKYRVEVHQIGQEKIRGVSVGLECGLEYGYTCVGFMYDPAGNLHTGFMSLIGDTE